VCAHFLEWDLPFLKKEPKNDFARTKDRAAKNLRYTKNPNGVGGF
jgi:hypothetical protein